MLTLRHLKYFIAISEAESFVAAAKKLNTVQSSLSQQMKDLEDHLGVNLFDRGSRVMLLTSAGNIFLQEAKKVLVEAAKTENFVLKLRNKINLIKIGILTGVEVKIPRYFLENRVYQDQTIEIEIVSDNGLALMQKLEIAELDITFTRCEVNSAAIKSYACISEALVVVLPQGHELQKYSHIPIKALNNIELVMPSHELAAELYHKILGLFQEHQLHLNMVIEAENPFVAMSYVSMGMGAAILPDYIASIATSAVTIKPFLRIQPKIDLFMNCRESDNPSLDLLLDCVKRIN
jgi:LysR family hca operon transcriptional activator